MSLFRILVCTGVALLSQSCLFAQSSAPDACPRPPAGSAVSEPEDLHSHNGVLEVTLAFRSSVDPQGHTRYCYIYNDKSQAPNLRLSSGDVLILNLKNEIAGSSMFSDQHSGSMDMKMDTSCAGGQMTSKATNLHFHGLTIPPVCHQDDVLKTMIGPGDRPFQYRFQIPPDESPGLHWYHPHVHGYTSAQVLGGASGALIVEGIERANTLLTGLPERILIVRDQDLLNPEATPSKSTIAVPLARDAEGDSLNTGNGLGKPAKDLSINFVPVPYPDYPPGVIAMKPSERQLWRVLNASAITYLDLQILVSGAPQPLAVVSLDGTPINQGGKAGNRPLWQSHALLPPAGRIEFVYTAPPEGSHASLVTRAVDTGPAGENDPIRPLADIVSRADAPEPRSTLPRTSDEVIQQRDAWLGTVNPVRVRKLYFSEKPSDPKDPESPTVFMLTVDGQNPVPFDPHSTAPNLMVQQGDVEDWIIENRTQELHAFHIHQTHFLLKEWNGVPVDEPYLRDTINVAYWDGASPAYPSVKLRMDFRDPNSVGTFVYHCHLLEHEDGGMMGTIQVVASSAK